MDLSSSDDEAIIPRRKPAKKRQKRESLVGNDDFLDNLLNGGAAASGAAAPVPKAEKAAVQRGDGPKGTINSFFGKKTHGESCDKSSSSSSATPKHATLKPTTPKALKSATWISTKKISRSQLAKELRERERGMLMKQLKNKNRYVWARRILPHGRTACKNHLVASGSFILTLGSKLHGRVRHPGSEDEKKLKLRRQVEVFFRTHDVSFNKKQKMSAAKEFLKKRVHKSAKVVKDELRKKAKEQGIEEAIMFSDVPKIDQDPRGSESLVLAVEELELEEPSVDWLWWPALVVDRRDRCMVAQDPHKHIEEGDVWYSRLGDGDDFRLVRWFPLVNSNWTLKAWNPNQPVASHYAVVQSAHTELFKTTKKSMARREQKMAEAIRSEDVLVWCKMDMSDRLARACKWALHWHASASFPSGESSQRFAGPSQCSQSQSQSQHTSSSQFDGVRDLDY